MSKKLPSFQFYPGDWIKDPNLSMCSPSTRGIWIDLLCAMHESDRSGQITGAPEQLARVCRCTPVELVHAVEELQKTETASISKRDNSITVICKRMKRESQDRLNGAERQARFRERGGGDPENWTAIRAVILVRDKKICAYCGRKATTVDHVFPKSRGGASESWNLVSCCRKCNSTKGDRTIDEAGMKFIPSFDASVINKEVRMKSCESNTGVTPPSSTSSSTSVIPPTLIPSPPRAEGEKVSPSKKPSRSSVFRPPTPEEVKEYAAEIGYSVNEKAWCDWYRAKGWKIGKSEMKDWKAALRNWHRNGWQPVEPKTGNTHAKTRISATLGTLNEGKKYSGAPGVRKIQ